MTLANLDFIKESGVTVVMYSGQREVWARKIRDLRPSLCRIFMVCRMLAKSNGMSHSLWKQCTPVLQSTSFRRQHEEQQCLILTHRLVKVSPYPPNLKNKKKTFSAESRG